jgi:hypothetical protein
MATHIMHDQPIPLECAVVKVTTIREGCEFEDLDYLDEEEGIKKFKDAKGNFILWPCKDIILKTRSTLIVSPHSREDESSPTSQNTIHSTTRFTHPSQNPPRTTPPPENPPSTQPLQHHSPQHRSPPYGHSPKSPPHTTHLQNPPTEQAPQQYFPPHVHSLKSPYTTLLFKIHQLNKLLSNVLLHIFILQSLLTLPLLFKIHQLNKLLSNVLLHMLIL